MHSSNTKGQRIFCAHVLHNKDVSAKNLSPCVIFGSTFLNSLFCNTPDSTLHVLCNECLPYIFSTESQIMWCNTPWGPFYYFYMSLLICQSHCLFINSSFFIYFFLPASSAFFPCSDIGCFSAH